MAYWTGLALVDGYDAKIWVQADAATATPGTADELGFVTEAKADNSEETTDRGPWLNLATKRKSRAGKTYEVTATCDVASGAQAAKNLITAAFIASTNIKITIQPDPTTGDKWVYDGCSVTGINLSLGAADGHTYEFTFAPTSLVFTPDAS